VKNVFRKLPVLLAMLAILAIAAPASAVPPPNPYRFDYSVSYDGWIDDHCPSADNVEIILMTLYPGHADNEKVKVCDNIDSHMQGYIGGWLFNNNTTYVRINKMPGTCSVRLYTDPGYMNESGDTSIVLAGIRDYDLRTFGQGDWNNDIESLRFQQC
jgi:hypothetical protein